jgi:TPR repeat protein
MMFQNEGNRIPSSNLTAVYWFERAAIQGHQNSQFELAGLYYRGLGVKKDLNQAKYWAKLASQGNNPTIASRSREFLKNQMSWWEKQKLGASSLFSIFSGN